MPYISIFERPVIITRKDLCEFLNLDIGRPGLRFSEDEIQRAFRKRALRFHPDKQHHFPKPIPVQTCNILMQDLVRARDHLINGDDNIPGAGIFDQVHNFMPEDWMDVLINGIHDLKQGIDKVEETTGWIYHFSSGFYLTFFLSCFVDKKLNFDLVNQFHAEFAKIQEFRDVLKNVNGEQLGEFLHQIKDALNRYDLNDAAQFEDFKNLFPVEIMNNPKFNDLLISIKEVHFALKNLLTDKFIKQSQHIVKFWAQNTAVFPSWGHIMSVYFFTLILTASNLPKFFSALKVIAEVILRQKGMLACVLTALPLLILSGILLPINASVQLGADFLWLALKASLECLFVGMYLSIAIYNLMILPFGGNESLSSIAFVFLRETVNLIRLGISIILDTLSILIRYTIGFDPLSQISAQMNDLFKQYFYGIQLIPEIDIDDRHINEPIDDLMVAPNHPRVNPEYQAQEQEVPEAEAANFGFFNNQFPIHNPEDHWLNALIVEIDKPEEEAAPDLNGMNRAA